MTSPADVQSVLDLPFETVLNLAAGYMAYRVAWTGRDSRHAGIDVAMITLVFAGLSQGSVLLARLLLDPQDTAVQMSLLAAGPFAALFAAAFWRRWGCRWALWILRRARISTSDRSWSAWDAVRSDDALRPTQIILRRRDGTLLMCDNLAAYEGFPSGPCALGDDGSVALYVTAEKALSDPDWTETDPRSEGWGCLLTYVPASEIASIHYRLTIT